ncbi:MAG: hypothetical protein AB1547_04495 [Thermodesulfobacteriota bacterium]
MSQRPAYITGIGSYSPGDPVPFEKIEHVLGKLTGVSQKLARRIERLNGVLKEMLGVEYSHYAIDPDTGQSNESNVSMCEKSARQALKQARIEPRNVELIVYAGILYDMMCPPSSVLVQDALGIPYCAEMSIHSNCTAIYKALQVAADAIRLGRYNNALVVTSQMSSAFLRAPYFNQKAVTVEQVILRWFLSDGAGALVLSADPGTELNLKVTETYLESVGLGIKPSMRMVAGALNSNFLEVYEKGLHHLEQDISTVSELAPKLFKQGFNTMLEKTGLNVRDITCFFANIPTKHMMDLLVNGLRKDHDFPELKFYTKLAHRGYPGAPAVVIALDDYIKEVGTRPGDRLVSFVTESSKWMHAGFILDAC